MEVGVQFLWLIYILKMVWKCDKCGKEFESKDSAEKHEEKCKGKKIKTCPNCGKELRIFKTGLVYRLGDKRFCSIKCKNEYKNNSKGTIEEYKRKCNECGKVWHSLVSREKEIEKDVKFNACIQVSTACGGNLGAATQSKRSVESQQDLLDKLKKCPACGSRNYKEEIITYEKH